MTYKFTVKMKPRHNLYGIHNDFSGVGGGLRRRCILIRNKDGVGGMTTFLDVAHMVDATSRRVWGWGGGDDNVPWRCTHGRCYITHGVGYGWGGVGEMITFLDIAHMVDAHMVNPKKTLPLATFWAEWMAQQKSRLLESETCPFAYSDRWL